LLLPEEYKNVIIAPFLNSLRYGNDLFKLIDRDAYYDSYKKYVDLLMRRPTAQVKMALLSDNTVLGWCLYEPKIVHYFWVKKEVRRQGIGKSLLPKGFTAITHVTNQGIKWWVNYYPEVIFDPFK
jgi:GNAT superfamily N-acetyltransferase